MIMETVEEGKLPLTARNGVLSLLGKVGKDPLELTNWRPLTLLNNDNKIYAKALANRLKTALPTLIHFSQTGFMPGRHMAENILKIQEVMTYAEDHKINGTLISFDFEKAFDTVEWPAIFQALELFNFGPTYINMVKVLFNEPITYVMNNGFWAEPIFPSRGARQGCCYSLGVFNLVVELLGIGIRNNKNILGYEINGNQIKAGQFADDLWATLRGDTPDRVNEILRELIKFQEFSGLKLNYNKCAILKIGPWRHSDAKFYTLKKLFWSPKSIKILGIYVNLNPTTMYNNNFLDMLDKVDSLLKAWYNRSLTILGKITVVNNLINTLFIHKFLALPSPDVSFLQTYKRMILDFIWDNKTT